MEKRTFSKFYWQQRKNMEVWRDAHISTTESGTQKHPPELNEKTYRHIVPFQYWKETIFQGIKTDLINYIDKPGENIITHEGVHNLLSSWILCANLYFYTRINENFKNLMLRFLQHKVSEEIIEIVNIELEFAFPEGDELHPELLLGELNGTRGKNQTSPDVAFLVKTKTGNGIILTESKYLEHNFYDCSTNPDIAKYKSRNLNPVFSRCLKPAKGYDYKAICHQTVWKRKYMDLIEFSSMAEKVLLQCPAAFDGYQLFRQQAFAEGIAQSGRYELAASAVAYDGRNEDLIGCLKTTGIENFTEGWELLFTGKALFKTWTHQEWVKFVRDNQLNGEFNEWLVYLNQRYGY